MLRERMRRQPRWVLFMMAASAACTVASLLMRDPNHALGGPVLYFTVLGGSGALLALSIVLLLVRGRTGTGDR